MPRAKFAELFYDSDMNKIGLMPKKYPTKSGLPIRSVGKSKSTYRVNTKFLVEHYNITINSKKIIAPVWNEGEGLLEIGI